MFLSVFEKVKEEQNMCEALKELMRPEIEEEINRAIAAVKEKAWKDREAELIAKWRAQGKTEEEIKALLR